MNNYTKKLFSIGLAAYIYNNAILPRFGSLSAVMAREIVVVITDIIKCNNQEEIDGVYNDAIASAMKSCKGSHGDERPEMCTLFLETGHHSDFWAAAAVAANAEVLAELFDSEIACTDVANADERLFAIALTTFAYLYTFNIGEQLEDAECIMNLIFAYVTGYDLAKTLPQLYETVAVFKGRVLKMDAVTEDMAEYARLVIASGPRYENDEFLVLLASGDATVAELKRSTL